MNIETKAKKPFWKKWWIWVGAIIIIGGLASAGGNTDTDSQTQLPTDSTNESQSQTNTSKETTPPKPAIKTYKSGMYKVGVDMPAGEYVLVGNSLAYFQIAKDSTGQLESIIANDNFSNRSIITVKDGQYVTLTRCTAYAFKDAPKVNLESGFLPQGMYKVGVDLPAGEYKVIADGMGYMEVSSNSNHDLNAIVSNDNFQGEKYITVKDGQYLKLTRAKIKVN